MMRLGISETAHGFTVCVLQENGMPSMSLSRPFWCERDAITELHRIELGTEVRAWKAQ